MGVQTLKFEDINPTGTYNGETVAWWGGNHKNASGWQKNYIFSKGRYGQEENDQRGDAIDQLPICPYHMPKNPSRFDEPSLFIAKKNPGDIIKARDINEVINRIRMLMYVWNAEIKDVYNYGGYDKAISPRYELLDTLEYIKSENAQELTDRTHDSRKSGARDNLKYLKRYYFMAESESLRDLETILNAQKANPTNFDTTDNNECSFRLPHTIDTNLIGADMINTGFHELYNGKFVQEYGSYGLPHPEKFHIYFPNEGTYLMEKDTTNVKFFEIGNNYFFSYRKTSDIDCPVTYLGFTSYFQPMESVSETTTTTTTTTTTVAGKMNIIKKHIPTNLNYLQPDLSPAGTSDATIIDSYIYEMTGLATGHLSPRKSIIQPAYKIEDDKIYRKYPSESIWKEVLYMYIMNNINYGPKTSYTKSSPNPVVGQPPIVTTYYIQQVYIGVSRYRLFNAGPSSSLEVQSSMEEFTILNGNSASTYAYTPEFVSDVGFTTMCDTNSDPDGWTPESDTKFIGVKFKRVIHITDTTYEDNTLSLAAYGNIYEIGWLCADGSSADVNNQCTLTTVNNINESSNITVANGVATITDRDIYPVESNIYYGIGKFPIIKGSHFKLMRNHLAELIDAVIDISSSSVGFTAADASTKAILKAFLNAQAPKTSDFDKDNPDVTFVGYQANTSAIIKYEFYNTLVDAYKLLINGCICNSDCYCNVNCVCNSNCGCNYSG